jgi:hypothetical protein
MTAPRTAPAPGDRAMQTAGRADAWTIGVVDAGELVFCPSPARSHAPGAA